MGSGAVRCVGLSLHIFPLTTAPTSVAGASAGAGAGGESQNRKLVPSSSNAANFCSHHQTVVKKIEMVFFEELLILCLDFLRFVGIHAF